MKKIVSLVKSFHQDESGDIVQTGIVIGLFAVIAVGAVLFLKTPIENMFRKGSDALNEAGGTGSALH